MGGKRIIKDKYAFLLSLKFTPPLLPPASNLPYRKKKDQEKGKKGRFTRIS
jgi:hypothetical protein